MFNITYSQMNTINKEYIKYMYPLVICIDDITYDQPSRVIDSKTFRKDHKNVSKLSNEKLGLDKPLTHIYPTKQSISAPQSLVLRDPVS